MRRRPPKGPPPVRKTSVLARATLAVTDRLARPLRARGVDPEQFRRLVMLEFTLGERRHRAAKEDGARHGFGAGGVLGLILNMLLGLIGAMALWFDDPLWGAALPLAMLMVFLTLTVVGDHLPAFVEAGDVAVLAPLPVADRTVIAARITHVVANLAALVGTLSVGPLVIGTMSHGPLFPLVWIAAAASCSVTAVVLALGLFLVILRVFDPQRFRDLLLFAQVGLFVVIVGGFQILPRIMSTHQLEQFDGLRAWWMIALPPCHGGALLALVEGDASPLILAAAVLAVVLPVAGAAFVLGRLGDGFVAKLVGMRAASGNGPGFRARRRPLRDLVLRTPAGRAGYDFCRALAHRERSFRLRAYPMVAMSFVIAVSFTFRRGEFGDPRMLSASLYLLALYIPQIVLFARFSDDFEARWLFKVLPFERPGEFLVGAFAALLATFVVPAAIVLALASLALGGLALLPDLVFAALVVLAITLLALRVVGRSLPFTERVEKRPAEGWGGSFFLMSLVVASGVGAHVLLRMSGAGFYVALVVLALVVGVQLSRLHRIAPNVGWLTRDYDGSAPR